MQVANGQDNEKGKLGSVSDKELTAPPRQPRRPRNTKGRSTYYLWLAVLTAASCGLLFGFDNGIIGGVTGSRDFQCKFLPDVCRANFLEPASTTNYCKFDSQVLTLIVSSLYLAAGLVAPIAGKFADIKGRKLCIVLAGLSFAAGIILLATSRNLTMVILGRVLMGGGVGFANSASTLYIVEMAPAHLRGALGIMFQLVQCVGILVAYVYNYSFHSMEWGWRLAIALGGVFAAIVIVGGLLLPDTPISLLRRGKPDKARQVLEKVRGTKDVDDEFEEMTRIVQASQQIQTNGFKSLLFNPAYRPQLAVVLGMPIFQQWTGINSVIFYTPQIFSYVSQVKGLQDTVVVGAVNVIATLVAVVLVDYFGRKKLFAAGGLTMAACMVVVAATLGTQYARFPDGHLPSHTAQGLLAVFCLFCASYAWSFGPLPWLLPSEVQPLETRAAAASLNTSFNMLNTFVVAQTFQTQLCAMRWGVFVFFAALTLLWNALIAVFIPETKGLTMDQVPVSFSRHWFWHRFQAVRAYGEARAAVLDASPQGGQQTMPALAVGH